MIRTSASAFSLKGLSLYEVFSMAGSENSIHDEKLFLKSRVKASEGKAKGEVIYEREFMRLLIISDSAR
ncbi:MAG: hypothetical protein RDV48_29520 [Candidatus Eremiobacteraeota bacterium]|nr:hypothetical protein [Candidatus Eremiobacteraeota bacterium]